MTTAEMPSVLTKNAHLSNKIIAGKRLTIVTTEYSNGWKRTTVILPPGVTIESGADVLHKKPINMVCCYMLFGQEHKCNIWAEKPTTYTGELPDISTIRNFNDFCALTV